MYLVDVSAESWEREACAPLLAEALAARGLPPYPGPPRTKPGFEEKLVPPMDAFAAACARHDATELLHASLIVPVEFTGLIELPAASTYDDTTIAYSAQRLRAAVAPIAVEVALPADLPVERMTLNATIDDPLMFYVAMYHQAAQYSLRWNSPLIYA
ncbi:hypothetical protein GCM10020218_000900 [Dactylosporangium vinaceum]